MVPSGDNPLLANCVDQHWLVASYKLQMIDKEFEIVTEGITVQSTSYMQ